jgi:hypothetical protein
LLPTTPIYHPSLLAEYAISNEIELMIMEKRGHHMIFSNLHTDLLLFIKINQLDYRPENSPSNPLPKARPGLGNRFDINGWIPSIEAFSRWTITTLFQLIFNLFFRPFKSFLTGIFRGVFRDVFLRAFKSFLRCRKGVA